MFLCLARSLRKVLETDSQLVLVVVMFVMGPRHSGWYDSSCWLSSFHVPGYLCLLLLFVCCMVVRLVRLVILVAMVTASFAVLKDSLIFCMNLVWLMLVKAVPIVHAIFIGTAGISWVQVLMCSKTVDIKMTMAIIEWRVCDVNLLAVFVSS